jgi:peptidoglycan hydrolase-like protein with peptidoglycan-binding domain
MAYKDKKRFSSYMQFFWNVSKPVGPSMTNQMADVALVQALLRICYEQGPVNKLQVDGHCGPKTREAIRKFQAEFSYYSVAAGKLSLECDGIVSHADNFGFDSPAGVASYTITALNYTGVKLYESKWKNLPYDPSVPLFLRLQLMHNSA